MVIADDHQIVRDGLKQALQAPGVVEPAGMLVLAEAENGFEALAETRHHAPDVLLLDVSMPQCGGSEIVADIRRWCPGTRIVILTGINAPAQIAALLDTGVDGMFSKGGSLEELYDKLPVILRGGHYIAARFVELLQDREQALSLTDRELQILNMIIAGRTSREIAELLSISPKTVDKHRTSLMQKLNVHSVAELMAKALQEGFIDTEHG